jgi:hypothetical protein
MSLPRDPDPQLARKNRRMLLGLLLLFFGGMLVAGLLRFSGWRPDGMKNRGELLEPYGDLRAYTPTLANGRPYRWQDQPRTWRMVAMPRECDGARAAACRALLGDLDKVWRLMGRHADRVHLLWAGEVPAGVSLPREVHVVRDEAALRAGLPRWDVDPALGEPLWLIDPNGFVFMRYAPGFDPGDVRTDLARMLKIN